MLCFSSSALYRASSFLLMESRSERRVETSFKRAGREWVSCTCVLKWLVRLVMRSDRIATWTSGEPVSPALVAFVLMTSALRSAAIDIVKHFHGCEPDWQSVRSG